MQPSKTHTQRHQQQPQQLPADNFLEAIKSISQGAGKSLSEDLLVQGSKDFFTQFGQLLGIEKPKLKASGELKAGESLEIDTVIQEQNAENKQLKLRLKQEQTLREQDRALVEEKTQVLKLQLKELISQTQRLAKSTSNLSQEVKIAAMQTPAEAGVYHVTFFERLIGYIRDFRKKIDDASLWLHFYNQRSIKMRMFWGQVGKFGAKRLLSSEDYMTRSAG